MTDAINRIRDKLKAARKKGDGKCLRAMADEIADIALGQKPYPDECFDLICEFISKKEMFEKSGADDFIFTVFLDQNIFTNFQMEKVFGILEKNFDRYEKVKLYWVICDFIARGYSPNAALNFFENFKDKVNAAGKEGIALGVDIATRRRAELQ